MFRAKASRGRQSEPKEIPEWKRQMQEDYAGPSEAAPAAPKRAREEEQAAEGSAGASAPPPENGGDGAGGGGGDDGGDGDDDDDDDDDVDLSKYHLHNEEEEKDADGGQADATSRVIVTNLAFETTSASLERFFEGCGTVLRIDTPPANRYERNAHVTFATQEGAQQALLRSGQKLDGRRLVVVIDQGFALAGTSSANDRDRDDALLTYGYSKAARGNKYYGTVFADDDARSREKLQKREDKRSGKMGLGQPTGSGW